MALILRPIRPEDNPALARIVVDVLGEFGIRGEGFACNDPDLHRLSEIYATPGSAYWVVEDDVSGQVLGGGGFTRLEGTTPEEGVCELQKYYFLPAARGQGVGRRLLEKILEEATGQGYRTMYLETVHAMAQALKLYAHYGFTSLNGPMGNTGHSGCTVWMAKSLEPVAQAAV